MNRRYRRSSRHYATEWIETVSKLMRSGASPESGKEWWRGGAANGGVGEGPRSPGQAVDDSYYKPSTHLSTLWDSIGLSADEFVSPDVWPTPASTPPTSLVVWHSSGVSFFCLFFFAPWLPLSSDLRQPTTSSRNSKWLLIRAAGTRRRMRKQDKTYMKTDKKKREK